MNPKRKITAADMGETWKFWPSIVYVLWFSVGVALLIKLLVPMTSFVSNFAVSSAYAVPICLMISLLIRVAPGMRLWLALMLAVLVGEITGTVSNSFLHDPADHATGHGIMHLLNYIGVGLIFSAVGVALFFLRSRMLALRTLWQQEQVQRATQETLLAESRLQALQSQIEPHFIFNTLANVQGLIETDPVAARKMLESFTRLLRYTLNRSRDGDTTLGREIEIVREYLSIHQYRLGARLKYRIDVAEALLQLSFPSLLLQPLVENAVKHGIEPAIEGGEVSVMARVDGARLLIEVRDTGRGFVPTQEPGIGLANVRERLATIYGDAARLTLTENDGSGVRATVEIPFDERA